MAHTGSAISIPNHGRITKYKSTVNNTSVIRFSQKPHRTIWLTEILLLASTTVLGPVAAGIMNAQEHAIAAGIMIISGFTFAAIAILANMGKSMLADAVLELNSVNINTKASTIISTKKKGNVFINVN